jgi:tetratricopeptide (TPR) repeat protein
MPAPEPPPKAPVKTVMISSTALDLPEHRELVKEACLRLGMFPVMMEHLPASDAGAIAESMRMVDKADLYLGIYAYRYGTIPTGYDISVTEMEYNRAGDRGIPRLIFIVDKAHPIRFEDVEMGDGAKKLEAFKARIKKKHVVNFFKSPQELHAQVINTLSQPQYRQPDLTAFHYVSDIPEPPEAYIAHPYTLLQTPTLIGRQTELNLLTDWVAKPGSVLYQARILSVVAIGGMGKSALTWKWFHDIAPHEMQPLAGRLWWSFYESDATFDNFVIRALAYVSRRTQEEIQKLPPPEREAQLLSILDREPFLLVLDGLERLLIAYARMDAARLLDDDLDERTANVVAGALGLPESAAQSFTGQHRLRKTADLRTGSFLRKLATVRASRVLVSTRLYPADLQTDTGYERAGCGVLFLEGLSDDDALNLWRTLKITGSREVLVPLFHTFDNHPLLIQVLAGEIAHDRHAPGDFDIWRKTHPDFDPFRLPLVQAKSHILEFALRGLDEAAQKVLTTIAAFRMPAAFDTLVALFVGEDKSCPDEPALIAILADLEDRGLLGWDRRANRYDLHPIVRGVTWAGLGNETRHGIYETLNTHFESLPKIDEEQVERLEDLTSAIELYNTLIGLERYDEASAVFRSHLLSALHYRLGVGRQLAELLMLLFPDGLEQLPRLNKPDEQAFILNELALSLGRVGQPGHAPSLYRRDLDILERTHAQGTMWLPLTNLSNSLRFSGALFESESAARRALLIAQRLSDLQGEVNSLYFLGITLAARGRVMESSRALERSIAFAQQGYGYTPYDYQAMRALWLEAYGDAERWAEQAVTYNQQNRFERGMIRATRLQGEAALGLDELATADERLHHALVRARRVNFVEEELAALIGLAELRRRQSDLKAAHELLDDVWEPAERGPYRLFHADACNVLAQIERDAGNHAAAVESATKAYRLAWCNGPPFAYYWGLQKAKAHLAALGAPEPEMPPFDASKYESMPEVEIVPPDEEKADDHQDS